LLALGAPSAMGAASRAPSRVAADRTAPASRLDMGLLLSDVSGRDETDV
jgi:hypothetical protein